jgi:hypothetical protein
MKHSALVAKLREQKQAKPEKIRLARTQPAEAAPVVHKVSMLARWRWPLLGAGLVGAGIAIWALCYFVIWNTVPAALVGKWTVQGGPMKGGVFQFYRSGALEVHHEKSATMIMARVTVNDKTLLMTTHDTTSGQGDTTKKITIRELTESSLILELENGDVLKMVRKK